MLDENGKFEQLNLNDALMRIAEKSNPEDVGYDFRPVDFVFRCDGCGH